MKLSAAFGVLALPQCVPALFETLHFMLSDHLQILFLLSPFDFQSLRRLGGLDMSLVWRSAKGTKVCVSLSG